MGSKARLERLQRELNKRRPALPVLCLWLDDDGLYSGKGRTYTADEVAKLEDSHQIITIMFDKNWKSGHDDGRDVISLRWPEDE